MKKSYIRKAIIAAAGTGSRLAPLTHAIPKEMLPIGRKPVLHYIVDELRSAGIREVLFIVSQYKLGIIEKYFRAGRKCGLKFDYLVQHKPSGSGQAVLCAQSWVGKEYFAVAWGDTLVYDSPQSEPPLKRMIRYAVDLNADALVLTERVSRHNKHAFRHAVVPFSKPYRSEFWSVARIIAAESRACRPRVCAGIAGRWVLSPSIFDYFQQLPADKEMYLVDAVSCFLSVKGALTAMVLRGNEHWCDIGTWNSYLRASLLGIYRERLRKFSSL